MDKEFIDKAKSELLTNEEMEKVAGGVVSVQISGVKREGTGASHYSADSFMLNQMKKDLADSNLKKVENLLRTGEW